MSRLMAFLGVGGSPRRRIGLTVAATGFARVITVAYNFFLVPILLSAWGVQIYGEWIVLSALASMAALSNVGFVQASASEIVIRVSADDHAGAGRVLSTTMICLIALSIAISGIGLLLIFSVNPLFLSSVHDISTFDARLILFFSILTVLCGFFNGPLSGALGAVAGAGIAQAVLSGIKILEMLAVIAAVFSGAGPLAVAGLLVCTAACGPFALAIMTRRLVPWIAIFGTSFDRETFRRLIHPSLSQFLLYASVNIVAIQLPRVVLGRLGGAPAVAEYSVALTYARSARMLAGMIAQSVQIELSRAYAEGKRSVLERLVEYTCQLNLWSSAALSLVLFLGAGIAFRIWTRGDIPADRSLLMAVTLTSIAGAYCDGYVYFLTGINRVWALAVTHFGSSVLALLAGTLLYQRFGIAGFAAAFALPEFATAMAGLWESHRILNLQVASLFARTLKLPLRFFREAGARLGALLRPLIVGSKPGES